jgi:hypothetical protein
MESGIRVKKSGMSLEKTFLGLPEVMLLLHGSLNFMVMSAYSSTGVLSVNLCLTSLC